MQVVHVGFSLDYRDLILHIQRAKTLKQVHTENCLDLLTLMGVGQQAAHGAEKPPGPITNQGGLVARVASLLFSSGRRAGGGRKPVTKGREAIAKARRRARSSLAAVEANERHIKRLMRERYKCSGYAFVTFNKYQVCE